MKTILVDLAVAYQGMACVALIVISLAAVAWGCDEIERRKRNRRVTSPESLPLDCSHGELVAYIRSMKGGERVMEMGGSGMVGMKGTVEIRDSGACIRWDHAEYADGAGVMVTSFTGGARIIQKNADVLARGESATPTTPKPQ